MYKITLLSLLLLSVSACASIRPMGTPVPDHVSEAQKAARNCPAVTVSENLSVFNDYAPRVKRMTKNLKSRVKLQKKNSSCAYQNGQVSVNIAVDFYGELGRRGRLYRLDAPLYSYPFFVATVNDKAEIVAKQIFAATMPYPSTGKEGRYSETIRQTLPVSSRRAARKYSLVLGFQLTEQQLAENRAAMQRGDVGPKPPLLPARKPGVLRAQPLILPATPSSPPSTVPASANENTQSGTKPTSRTKARKVFPWFTDKDFLRVQEGSLVPEDR